MLFEFICSTALAAVSVYLLAMLYSFGYRYPTQVFYGLAVVLTLMALSCSYLALLKDLTVLLAYVLVAAVFYRRMTPAPKEPEEDLYLQRGGKTADREALFILGTASKAMVLSFVVLPLFMWGFGKNY